MTDDDIQPLQDANVETLEAIRDDLSARPQDRINAANALVAMKAKGQALPSVYVVITPEVLEEARQRSTHKDRCSTCGRGPE